MYRFLASTRWIGWLLLVCIFAGACVFLGRWQMDRRAEVLTEISHVNENYFAPASSSPEALALFEELPADKKWTTVALEGQYLAEDTRVVRNRIKAGRPGYEVLVPFRLTDGRTVVVDRGYLPIGDERAGWPDQIPEPPAGTVQVEVRLKPGEPTLDRQAPEGQLATVNLPTYAGVLDYPIAQGAYGIMYAETPAPATAPQPLDEPDTDEGPHLSYSYQWFAFGLLAFVGFWYAAKQQRRLNREDAEELAEAKAAGFDEPIHKVRKIRTKQVKRYRRDGSLTDEAIEDAMLDGSDQVAGPGAGDR
ncbi:SURF1 family protein [Glutamicibacter sp. MNS18]|uniref:SURF1 family cytochrome oxidase biogenesis protein n=1 Tax=Glutamicibacter sp. MNS18 TaxID=2989817 RepID=UPI0022357927|nr:SURF1 family protein [Glutamicibacter sp. MNS18]MCW4464945.1 SURF1 family protein [Glutamicibacter sp. MNS18]